MNELLFAALTTFSTIGLVFQLILRPAFSPFCLGDMTLDASTRWKGWFTMELLLGHVMKIHSSNLCAWPQCCPHPNCLTRLDNFVGLADHFNQHHGLPAKLPSF